MDIFETLFFLSSAYPLGRAWFANRATTLVHALNWTVAAWLAWCAALLLAPHGTDAARFLALCLTCCAAVAVLGARRPIVGAWNAVLVGLLAVLLLPLAQNAMRGIPLSDPLQITFLACTLAVGVLNYMPTRLVLAVVLAGMACTAELLLQLDLTDLPQWRLLLAHISPWLLPLACWLGLFTTRRNLNGVAVFDREWLVFRDRFGLMWGQRIREQFNRAAANADWPVHLRWRGLRKTANQPVSLADQDLFVQTLRGLLQRFGPAKDH